MLKIAKITLPEQDNNGNSNDFAHNWLKRTLLQTFGGYTVVPVSGAWLDEASGNVYEDESLRYEVATNDDAFSISQIEQIADEAGRQAGQLAVAVELPGGVFVIRELTTPVSPKIRAAGGKPSTAEYLGPSLHDM